MRWDYLLSPTCLSTLDRLISLGHILAAQCANRPERERERQCSHIVLIPAPKTINNNDRDPLAAAEIKTPLPAQLDGAADCWPTPESEINSLFSLIRENMQTSRRARRYAKSWQEDGDGVHVEGCFRSRIGWREGPPLEEVPPSHLSVPFSFLSEHVLGGLRRNIPVSPPYSSFLSWLSVSQSGSTSEPYPLAPALTLPLNVAWRCCVIHRCLMVWRHRGSVLNG